MGHGAVEYPSLQEDSNVYEFSPAEIAEIQKHVAKYPSVRSAIMPALWIAQEKYGWLPQGAIKLVADTLNQPYAHVFGVASFYTMYLKEYKGKHLLEFCTCFTCGECGGDQMFKYAWKKLDCNEQGISADGKIWIREAECLGACDTAPVCQIDNRPLRHNLDESSVDKIIEDLRADVPIGFVSIPLRDQAQIG